MGIKGLLQALKPYAEPVHVNKYAGERVGIDAYSWLHKGAYACSMELQQESSQQRRRGLPAYVHYCMHRIKMLKYNNITPVVVFDGGRLPLKALTEQDRRRRRETNLEQAQRKQSEGDMLGAQEFYQRSVEITPMMAHELIEVLREDSVEFVVAPYEADAQLAYLAGMPSEKGGIAAVISEDSDLLAYGCKAVLFKMDRYGQGEEICLQNLFDCNPPTASALSFKNFDLDLFLGMCVMAGCDFLASIPGIGVKRAHALLIKYRSIPRVLSKLIFEKATTFPENYIADFWQAKAIFSHARVYDRESRSSILLNPLSAEQLEEFEGNIDFLGPDLPQSRAKAIAEGRLDPITMEAFKSVPTPRSPPVSHGGRREPMKNIGSATSPAKPLSMYGQRKEPSKFFTPASYSATQGSILTPPSTPFSMYGAKKEPLRIFATPSVQAEQSRKNMKNTEYEESYWYGTEEELITNLVEDRHCKLICPSQSGHSRRDVEKDTLPKASLMCEQGIMETGSSVWTSTINETVEVDQKFLAQLKLIAGSGPEAPNRMATTVSSQTSNSGRANGPNNPFKVMTETSSSMASQSTPDAFRWSLEEARSAVENVGPSQCSSSGGNSIFTSKWEVTGDEPDCQNLSSEGSMTVFQTVPSRDEYFSPTPSVSSRCIGGEDSSPSSVLTEISPNLELSDASPHNDSAPVKIPYKSAGKTYARNQSAKLTKSKSTGHGDRTSRVKRLKTDSFRSPQTKSAGGILKFFKPVPP